MNHYKNWKITKNTKHIYWLGADYETSGTNILNSAVLNELNDILQIIELDTNAEGLIIYSCKKTGFIAGADVTEFSNFKEAKQILDFLLKGQDIFNKLASLKIPTVACINGFCMGGGLELALACDYRIATQDKSTILGLPEVLLGIHPGWGGTVRLPRLIGGFNALSQIILTGKPINAKRAKELGIVDDAVPYRQLERAALYYIDHKPQKHTASILQKATNLRFVKTILAHFMRKKVSIKINQQNYPAPFFVIDLWEKDLNGATEAYINEAESVKKLINYNETAKNLTRVFTLRERIKAFGKQNNFHLSHVHVIGAGVMGGDIAAWCALKGLKVTLQDKNYDKIAPAIGRAHALYKRKLREKRLIQAAMDNIIADPNGYGIKNADVIIEAVFENIEAKQQIIQHIEKNAKDSAILATNTSSIPLDEINMVMSNPGRLVGIHFFNPVPEMELVEIVSSPVTNTEVQQKACAFVGKIGKMPLPVKSSPGFLINRVLTPYLVTAMQLISEGYKPEVIDDAAINFGMVMGPVELADTVGIDICLAVADNLANQINYEVPEKLRKMVKDGNLGKKSGKGFYQYKKGKIQKKKLASNQHQHDLAARLFQPIIDESRRCLEEKVVADADLLDGGMIFATGFAPFRGGPIHYANNKNIS
jgi:3-hydroxyacyl-CoA dehydrogenase/enoyl-CoA hydratase/3-hydroxybutyryl-CoA epimerase